jgi:3-hydroxybutyryl-CoA dehydrogenase
MTSSSAKASTGTSRAGSVVVVGTGHVSPAVAAAFASRGHETIITGRSDARAGEAARTASDLGHALVRAAPLAPATFGEVALIVECVAENLAVKRALLTTIEPWVEPATVIATNTSSLPLDQLAEALQRAERFGGLHFLHPAHLTGVVEVVAASRTDQTTIDRLLLWAAEIGKRPIVVKRPLPGFVWNRLQMAMLRECLELVEQGVADAEAVDAAVSEGLAPRWLAAGPLATADLGGIAVFAEITRQLFPHLSAKTAPTAMLDQAEATGGFYTWEATDMAGIENARAEALEFGSSLAERRPRPKPRDTEPPT